MVRLRSERAFSNLNRGKFSVYNIPLTLVKIGRFIGVYCYNFCEICISDYKLNLKTIFQRGRVCDLLMISVPHNDPRLWSRVSAFFSCLSLNKISSSSLLGVNVVNKMWCKCAFTINLYLSSFRFRNKGTDPVIKEKCDFMSREL